MWERMTRDISLSQKGKLIGGLIGLIIGLSLVTLGILKTLVVVATALAGFIIGGRLDANHEDIFEVLDRMLPSDND